MFEPLEKLLKASAKSGGAKYHEEVHSIYVKWQPAEEIDRDAVYSVDLLVLCDQPNVADALEVRLEEIGLDPGERVERPGLLVQCSVQARRETILTDLDGWTRLTEWDHLTGLAGAAEMPSG